MSTDHHERLLPWPEVHRRTSISKVSAWRWARVGAFPRAVALSAGRTRIAWKESEIDRWVAERGAGG